ncbi:MAG: hypothetical protein IPI67_02925 [Myxococcales bacterium]|nr:hypothetical protein [Myxococcales bacterium]
MKQLVGFCLVGLALGLGGCAVSADDPSSEGAGEVASELGSEDPSPEPGVGELGNPRGLIVSGSDDPSGPTPYPWNTDDDPSGGPTPYPWGDDPDQEDNAQPGGGTQPSGGTQPHGQTGAAQKSSS